jgi:hypothetical protein
VATDNLEFIRGDNFTFNVTVLDTDGNAIDLTDTLLYFTAKYSPYDPDDEAVLHKTVGPGDNHGVLTVNFTSEETENMEPGSYWWDVQLIKDYVVTSTKRRLFKVVGDITRRVTDDESS